MKESNKADSKPDNKKFLHEELKMIDEEINNELGRWFNNEDEGASTEEKLKTN